MTTAWAKEDGVVGTQSIAKDSGEKARAHSEKKKSACWYWDDEVFEFFLYVFKNEK